MTRPRILAAAASYFALVFAAGFCLGLVRVPFLEPALGKMASVLVEAPFLVLAMVLSAHVTVQRFGLEGHPWHAFTAGLLAVALQQTGDLAVGVILRGSTLVAHVAEIFSVQSLPLLALLTVFAVLPLFLASQRSSAPSNSP